MAIKGLSPEHIKCIKEAEEAYKQFILPNIEHIREAMESFKRIRTMIEKLPLGNIVERMREAEKLLKQFVPEYIKFYEKHGWLYDLMTNETLLIVMGTRSEHFEDRVSFLEFLEGSDKLFHTEEGLKFVLKKIPKIIQRRKQYIQNVVEHHKDNNYMSSIPLALIRMEGIVRDFGVLKGYLKNEENPEYFAPEYLAKNPKIKKREAHFWEIVVALFGEKEWLMGREVEQPLTRQLCREFYTRSLRHSIIHGNKLAYEDSILSARLILALITLAQKAPEMEKTSEIKPYWII